MKNEVIKAFTKSLKDLHLPNIDVELTDSRGHGDFATNIAMKLAAQVKKAPLQIAQDIAKHVSAPFISHVEVAGPGFINIFLKNDALAAQVNSIIHLGKGYGKGKQGKYINVEYVSANPTGHLHLGHARGAALGSALVNVLRFAGNKVDSEYYINDAGNQIEVLGISAYVRYQQELGVKAELPEDAYRGTDIIECAKYLVKLLGDKYKNVAYDKVKEIFKEKARLYLLEVIKEHLAEFRVVIDTYSSEKAIYDEKRIPPTLRKLKKHTYEHEGALWLKTTDRGDDKDRVLVKSDKTYTYLTPDVAYHDLKLSRGYNELINIWGADHIGYIKRMAIALEYLGLPQDKLDILTVQLVKLMKNGEELKMSKRKGTSCTLQELVEEVGADVARWFMLDRSNNSEFVFDVDLAKNQSNDNPVFTVQYTHARAHQLLSKSTLKPQAGVYEGKEVDIINNLLQFPSLIDSIATSHKVHLLPQYLVALARDFNSWYSNSKLLGHEREASLLALVKATRQVLVNGLTILGISAPNKM